MSAQYEGQDPIAIAQQAERDLNSNAAKTGASTDTQGNRRGHGASDSTNESGVDQAVEAKFPGSSVNYGSSASGAGDNRDISLEEGGDINPDTGKLFKAKDYEGLGGPEDKAKAYSEAFGGDNAVRGNIRQQGESGALRDEARDGPSGQPVSSSGPGYTGNGASGQDSGPGASHDKGTGYSGTGP
ncbi:hypothetical protein LTR56_022893 [Elasticomyces elasticus]|nr:hypothetical protein LTR56_022893 [Elasticomyces elasticus]KAK3627201.1 hypothetical protein LTR22_022851 [Elasticomyces elasticus]KAK4928494.1 hypothetical protein LTR49_004901 [Elasticomyces elasticus]KAK5753602.1 hypothetical protein LTS12_016338 [Elasticomyces elasticus]